MADVINRETNEIYISVNTPDYPEPKFMVVNGKIFPSCENKYWKIIDNEIIEMSTEEKAVVDYVKPILDPTPEQIELIRKSNIALNIAKTYSITDEIEIIRDVLIQLLPNDVNIQMWNDIVIAAKLKYPKL